MASVQEVLPYGGRAVGGHKLEPQGIGGVRHHDDAPGEIAMFLYLLDYLGNMGFFLADRQVHGDNVRVLLVGDGIHAYCALAGSGVADDQFPLSPADGKHGIDDLYSRVERLVDEVPVDQGGCLPLDGVRYRALRRRPAVKGVPQRVHHPAEEGFPGPY